MSGFRWIGWRERDLVTFSAPVTVDLVKVEGMKKIFTQCSEEILIFFAFGVKDTGFHQVSVIHEERNAKVHHSLKLGLC